jgi:hypothetical protein
MPITKKKFLSKELDKRTPPWYWIKDSRGFKSITVTLVFVSFWVTTFAYLVSLVDSIGDIKFREFDVGAVSAYLIPILGLYFGRKWTDSKTNQEPKDENNGQ